MLADQHFSTSALQRLRPDKLPMRIRRIIDLHVKRVFKIRSSAAYDLAETLTS
jgi:hypothetical protein